VLIRQLLAIAILPFTVTALWIARANRIGFAAPHDVAGGTALVCGCAAGVVGVVLLVSTVYLFWSRGRGTLAPWDPPQRFVVDGPYRYVRNPMITGVTLMLVAEALVTRSRSLAEWASVFFGLNLVYIPLLEERMLEARFGAAYTQYKRHVRMFLPRLTPWIVWDASSRSYPPSSRP
jgi:protein-S-isoprenylcysteine O-methyltransferase Ste14